MYTKTFVFILFASVLFLQCGKKTAIIVERYGTLEFTTYTVDTFRFRVLLDGRVLTDSLLSPLGTFNKVVNFVSTTGRLQIIDANNNDQLVLDSIIPLKIGRTIISVVQFQSHQKPTTPPPIPNEPLPANGKYKIRFQYIRPKISSVPYYDSVRFILRKDGINIDTLTLKKLQTSKFYEVPLGSDFSMVRFESPTGTLIGHGPGTSPTNNLGGDFPGGLNTVIIYGAGGTAVPNYRYELAFVY